MASIKSHAYVLIITLLPLIVFLWRACYSSFANSSVSLLLLSASLYVWLLKTISYPHYFGPLRHLPCPEDDDFAFGHGLALLSRPPGRRFFEWMKSVPNKGIIRIIGFLHLNYRYVLTSPEAIADVLNNHPYDFVKPAPAKTFLSLVLGEGILLVEGREHKLQRRTVWPAFQGRHVRDLVPLFWTKSHEFASSIARDMRPNTSGEAKTGFIELSDQASRATLDIIGVAGLGRDFGTLHNSGDELASIFSFLTDPTSSVARNTLLLTLVLPGWLIRTLPLPSLLKIRGAAHHLRKICINLLAEKRAILAEKIPRTPDILSILIQSASMSDDELVDQLLTFLAAGHETTASATTWAAYMLAVRPEIQTRLRAEVRDTLARSGGNITAEHLDQMPYLNAVCSETLRYWATVPSTARVAARDTTIAGQPIPKGTQIFMAIGAMNRMPNFWGSDAETFNPNRWLARDGADANEVKERASKGGSSSIYNFLTFLHGPRSCIGQAFAQSELRCLVAALVDRFDIKMADQGEVIEPAGLVTIKPRHGLHLLVTDLSP